MPGMNKVQFSLHTALTAWQWSPFSIAVALTLVAIGYWYLRADWKLASRARSWRASRTLAFFAGLVAIDLALQSPVATFTRSYFEAHIVQHLLLMAVAPPLLALGAPSTLLLQTGSRQTKTRWLAVLHSRPFAVLTHPVTAWFAYFGVMFAFFLSPLINVAMEHMDLMDALNIGFFLGGTLYWWPIVGIDPVVHWRMGYGAKIATLAIGVPFETFLGVAIMSDHAPIASMYSLSSTHAGGALLWAGTEISTFVGLVPIFLQWMNADERAGARADERAARAEQAMAVQAREVQSPARQVSGEPARTADLMGPRLRPATLEVGALAVQGRPPRPPASVLGGQFMPLLQPGNSTWEALWKAKAGFVPRSSARGRSLRSPSAPGPEPGATPTSNEDNDLRT